MSYDDTSNSEKGSIMPSINEVYHMSDEDFARKKGELHISLFKNIFVLMALKWTIIILLTKYLTHKLQTNDKG